MIRQLLIKCPKCRTAKAIVAIETVEAFTEFVFTDGVCAEGEDTANEYGNVIGTQFYCRNCGHRWYGRKGPTIDSYSEEKGGDE